MAAEECSDHLRGRLERSGRGGSSVFSPLPDAILNMVNNIAANVLGGKPELADGTHAGGNPDSPASPSYISVSSL